MPFRTCISTQSSIYQRRVGEKSFGPRPWMALKKHKKKARSVVYSTVVLELLKQAFKGEVFRKKRGKFAMSSLAKHTATRICNNKKYILSERTCVNCHQRGFAPFFSFLQSLLWYRIVGSGKREYGLPLPYYSSSTLFCRFAFVAKKRREGNVVVKKAEGASERGLRWEGRKWGWMEWWKWPAWGNNRKLSERRIQFM